MNDVTYRIIFPKSTLINILVIHVIQTYRETPIKLKNCLIYDVISNAYAFFIIFWTKNLFLVPYLPKVPNIAECALLYIFTTFEAYLISHLYGHVIVFQLFRDKSKVLEFSVD